MFLTEQDSEALTVVFKQVFRSGAGHPRNGANGVSFAEKVKDAGAVVSGQLVHAGHYA